MRESSIWSLDYWKAAAERAARTAAQAALLKLGADSIAVNALTLNWPELGGFALGGAFVSVLMSVIGNVATRTGPSFGHAEQVTKGN